MPRSSYLIKRSWEEDQTSCRGGVTSPDGSDWELEIGQNQRCSPRMLAFCAHMDEIEEILLHNTMSKLTGMVLNSWWELEKELKNQKDYISKPKHETKKEKPKS